MLQPGVGFCAHSIVVQGQAKVLINEAAHPVGESQAGKVAAKTRSVPPFFSSDNLNLLNLLLF